MNKTERLNAAEQAEDAARPDDEHRQPIRAYEGLAGTGVASGKDERLTVAGRLPRVGVHEGSALLMRS